MKVAVAIALAALCLIGAMVFLRRNVTPAAPPPAAPPVPRSTAPTPAEPAPRAPGAPAARAAAVDVRAIATDLARALRDGDEKKVRALQQALHDRLHPPLADADNGAILYQKAFDLAREKLGGLSLQGLDRTIYSAAMTGKELTADQRTLLRDWFQKNGPTITEVTALLREAGQKPGCRFPDPDQKLSNNLSYAGNLLQLAARCFQEDGRADEAAEVCRTGFALARSTRSSPNILSQLLGCAQEFMAVDGLQRSLDPSSPKLAATLDAADPASVRDAFRLSLLGDLDWTVGGFLAWKADPATAPDAEMRLWAQGPLAMQDVAAYVEAIGDFLRVAERPYHETRGELDALVRKHGEFAPWYASQSKDLVRGIPGLTRTMAKSEAKMSMAKVALELERHRAQHGEYPATFDALKAPPPRDPFTGQPFAYRKEGGGFILESPGAPDRKEPLTWRSRN
jgi:hypothetical protein